MKKQNGEKPIDPNYSTPPSLIRTSSQLWPCLRASTALLGKKWYCGIHLQAIGFLVLYTYVPLTIKDSASKLQETIPAGTRHLQDILGLS